MKIEAKRTAGRAMPPKLQDGVETERVQIVAPASWISRIDEWRRTQKKIPSRSEAIRILVDKALDAGK
jgi:metal-responsive CopG/Arc/MetJ family transcriptional regulator